MCSTKEVELQLTGRPLCAITRPLNGYYDHPHCSNGHIKWFHIMLIIMAFFLGVIFYWLVQKILAWSLMMHREFREFRNRRAEPEIENQEINDLLLV